MINDLSRVVESLEDATRSLRQAAMLLDAMESSQARAREWFSVITGMQACKGEIFQVLDRLRESLAHWAASNPAVVLAPGTDSGDVSTAEVLEVVKNTIDEARFAPTMHLSIVRVALGSLRDLPAPEVAVHPDLTPVPPQAAPADDAFSQCWAAQWMDRPAGENPTAA
ncbi:hypothetical protein [Nonomuraea sp. SYSU D8015]|uniref:hypothetical protein n=1 Tax=Nonomuraea sp. SYSU D8015 TaxID=2593644 RepID=UPI0016608A0E|nr:hypothetical protein [Nonomuraea sp. SYSU D8015]